MFCKKINLFLKKIVQANQTISIQTAMKTISTLICITILIMTGCNNASDIDPVITIEYVDVGTDRIAYKVSGSGFPLLMCMGYSGTMDLWQPKVINRLSEQFQVIMYDYPGMGYSTTQDTAFSMKGLAANAAHFLTAIHVEQAHVLGWSMGTNVAQELALNYPHQIKKVILYAGDCGDTIAIEPPEWVADILTADDPSPIDMLRTLFPDEWLAAHPDPLEYFPEPTETSDPAIVAMQWAAFTKWNEAGGGSADRLSSFTQAVLLLTGDQDVCTPTANSYILLDSIPLASLILLEGCGHGAMYQLPDKFSDYVLAFLLN
ncbi:MAG: hypothetical protein CVT99_11370 [Bacteroidetes bacterium HGW-Bacteroidetes-16]|nr:MAG: hypothetical protein CVT99_11370 [Bacteroidetes bacterium HGW-Bacteroidetes-16]